MTPVDQSSPSKIVLQRLIAEAKFEPNIDNDDEEKYSDDEKVDQIKMHKFKMERRTLCYYFFKMECGKYALQNTQFFSSLNGQFSFAHQSSTQETGAGFELTIFSQQDYESPPLTTKPMLPPS